MSTNEELEALDAIRREISQAVPPGTRQGDRDWAVAACRLILEVRRERDEARLEREAARIKEGLDASYIAQLKEERGGAWEEGYQKGLNDSPGWDASNALKRIAELEAERDEARARVRELEDSKLPWCSCGDSIEPNGDDETKNDGRCIDCAFALEDHIERLQARIAQLESERDAALAELPRVRQLEAEAANAARKVLEIASQRDTALARAEQAEEELEEQQKVTANVSREWEKALALVREWEEGVRGTALRDHREWITNLEESSRYWQAEAKRWGARVREMEEDSERESVAQAHVLKLTREQLEWRDEELARLRARIAELVAEGAANARLREAFEDLTAGNDADDDRACMVSALVLRAALRNNGGVPTGRTHEFEVDEK